MYMGWGNKDHWGKYHSTFAVKQRVPVLRLYVNLRVGMLSYSRDVNWLQIDDARAEVSSTITVRL